LFSFSFLSQPPRCIPQHTIPPHNTPTTAQTATPLPFNQWSAVTPVQGESFGQFFSITIPGDEITREIIVKMRSAQSTANFDPDLFLRFDELPEQFKYDFKDASITDDHLIIIQKSTKYPMTAGQKLYIGVRAIGPVSGSFQVYAESHGCIYNKCGSESRGICNAETGECECKPTFQTLPFCQAQDKTLQLKEVATNTLLHNQIAYYNITLPNAPKKGWFHGNFVRTSAEPAGSIAMYIQKGRLPNPQDKVAQLLIPHAQSTGTIILDDHSYTGGVWTVAIVNNAKTPVSYTFTPIVHFCKNSCSHHGTCDEATSTCTCDEQYRIHPEDCSVRSDKLELGITQYLNPEPSGENYFIIPVSQELADAPLELGIHLELVGDQPSGGLSWPLMYVTTNDDKPTAIRYDFTSPLPVTWNQTLFIPDSKLAPGQLRLAIRNTNSRDFLYALRLISRPHCPSGCYKNGYCTAIAECNCFEGFVGGSCDISQTDCNKIRGVNPGTSFGAVFAVFAIVAALAAGVSAFVYSKFFFVAPQQSVPEMQYDPLAN